MHERRFSRKENKFLIVHSGHQHNQKPRQEIKETKEEFLKDTDSSEIITPESEIQEPDFETKIKTAKENQNIQSNPVSNLSQPENLPRQGLGELVFFLIIITPILLILIKSKFHRSNTNL